MNIWVKLLRQPVLVGLAAAALGLFGLASVVSLPVRSSPVIPPRYIDISTNFPGADAATVDKFVTLPLENAVSAIAGVQYVTGSTQPGNADINAFLAPGAVADTVFAEILAATNAARDNLPAAVQPSSLKIVGDDNANQELNISVLFPPSLSAAEVTAFTISNIVPRLETVPGIGPVTLYSSPPALLVTADPLRLLAQGLTTAQVARSLAGASTVAAAGTLRDGAAAMPVNTGGDLTSQGALAALPLGAGAGGTTRLGDVAKAAIGFTDSGGMAWWDRVPSVYVAAGVAPGGNIITVAAQLRRLVGTLQPMMPPGVKLVVSYDQSIGVSQSLRDLAMTLLVTILLVGAITVAALGSLRAAAAPFLAIFLSLLGAGLVMRVCGQSFNLFTIIALVLAVGLVVDDAIVVVEDIFRRTADGAPAREAAELAITRLAPVLAAISSTLVVAFLPLGFLSGLTAALFRPFALVLISAFLVSLAVALGIVPSIAMWASRTYVHKPGAGLLDKLRDAYVRRLTPLLDRTGLVAALVLLAVAGCAVLASLAPRNLDPAPDGLDVNIYAAGPNGASQDYLNAQALTMEALLHRLYPGMPDWLVAVESQHAIFGGYTFATPGQAARAVARLSGALAALPGLAAYVSQDTGLPGAQDLPVSVNISGQASAARLLAIAAKMQSAAYASGDFDFVQISPGQPQYQYRLRINRLLAARLGIREADIDEVVSAALSHAQLGQVEVRGDALNVTLALPDRLRPATLLALLVPTAGGGSVPLGTVASLVGEELPNALGSWQGLPSVNIQAQPHAGVAMSRALGTLRRAFAAQPTRDLSFGYSGPSETYREANAQNAKLFAFGLAGLFFLLAAQFRSLRDPFVVIATVPLASLGPLILCLAGGATLNIVTEIALLTVWGLIARQGILFVQVAHEGAALGLPTRTASLRAARLRFRPILMITLALLGGAVPLLLASGPQATIRYDLGAVLATGMGGGFLLSLFAVPALYCLLHRRRHAG
ncbi:efflux RND transporter permease subunit [Acidocella facilis]|uniref:efflux RND transporter permease subunit n=1 Tax=Acidocella facilis TaxID=525 RepID=UPI00047E07DE|nr:efflux RND transporter permease subunit [Acidocella facilis]